MSNEYEIDAGAPYAYGLPALIGGVWAYVVTAPEPQLTLDGPAATITGVRFVWTHGRCGHCRQPLHLYTDDGTIEAGLVTGHTKDREPALVADWYETRRPAGMPALPRTCPHPQCPSHARRPVPDMRVCSPEGRILSAGPFDPARTVQHPGQPLPVQPQVFRLLDSAWSRLRAAHPDLAALADIREAARIRRAAARRASRNRSTSR